MFEGGPFRHLLHLREPLLNRQPYEPHVVIYRSTQESPWVLIEFPNENGAIEKYEELVAQRMDTVIMAKRVRKHVG